MNFDDKFDKLIRKKITEAGENGFEFDESNWQKASRMIDAERGAAGGVKSGKLFLMVGTALLGVATVALLGLTIRNSSEQNQLAEATPVSVSANNNAPVSTDNTTQLTVSGVEQTSSANVNTNSEAVGSSNEIASNKNTANSSLNTIANSGNNAVINNTAAKSGNTEHVIAEHSNSNAGTQGNATGKINRKNNFSNGKNSSVNNPIAHITGKDQNPATPGVMNENGNEQEITSASPAENFEYMESRSFLLQTGKDPSLKASPVEAVKKDDDYFKKKNRHIHFMNVEGGAAFMFGWQTAKGRDAMGLNGFAGLNYGLYINDKTTISVGTQFYHISHINDPFYSRTSYKYDFGANGTTTNITSNSLAYVSIPVKISYAISKQSKVGVGFNAGMLFNGKNTIETFTEQDGAKINDTRVSMPGYYEGMNQKNMMLSVFYSQKLSKRVNLNGEFVYGLSDTYSNTVTKTNTKENQKGLRLSIQYTLFDK